MKRSALALTAMIFILLIAPVSSAATPAKDTWTSVRSKNFFLIGNANEKEIRQVATRLEQFRDVFTRLFSRLKFNSPVPTTVIVFKSDSSYKPFKTNPNLAGYFQPGQDVNYITLTAEDRNGDPFDVIFHEYTHLLLENTLGGNIPIWFNEGLAEYYSTFSVDEHENKVALGKVKSNHVLYLREQKLLPLRLLFNVDHRSPYYNEEQKQGVFYAEAWALVHYLILGNNGQRQPQLSRFVNLLKTNVPVDQAFEQAFQTNYEALEKELKSYITRDKYPFMETKLKDKLEFDATMESAPLTEAEAQAYLGDLLLHTSRLSDAETYLQKALALDASQPMALSSMGMLRVRQRRIDDAKKYLEQSVAANTQNYLAHYYYALALSREGMDQTQRIRGYEPERLQKMRAELRKAIDSKPDFPESYNLLAIVNMIANEDLDQSVEMLKKAQSLAPARLDFAFTLAQIYMRKSDFKAARQLFERIVQSQNADAALQQHAQAMLNQLISIDEQMARYKEEKANAGGEGASSAPAPGLGYVPYLEEVLRKPREGEQRAQGLLTRIDCDEKGIVFVVKVGDRLLNLHIDAFENMEITTYAADVAGELTCGARNPENTVVVSFKPSKDAKAKTDGEIVAIEFVPKEFKLKKQ